MAAAHEVLVAHPRWSPIRRDRAAVGARLSAYIALTKPRIIELLLVTTVPTMVLAERRGLPSLGLVLATVTGGTLAAGGANALNMVVDRDIDRIMRRTRGRPLVTGALGAGRATAFAVALEVVAFAELALLVNLLSAVLAAAAAAFYLGVYTLWLKRTSSQNIVIGGAAGAVPVLVGWAAVTDRLGVAPLVLFAVIFLWTPPHFWALAVKYREDYRAAEVPMLPAVSSLGRTAGWITAYTVAMVVASLALVPLGHLGAVYAVSAALLGGTFVALAVALWRSPSARMAMRLFAWSITYLTLLFAAVAADRLL